MMHRTSLSLVLHTLWRRPRVLRSQHRIFSCVRWFSSTVPPYVNPVKKKVYSEDDKTYHETVVFALDHEKIEDSKKIVRLALIGNFAITAFKGAAWLASGSSALLSEAIHSLVDFGNQALLLIGLRGADVMPDGAHQYGYGKSIYFWSLVSALGTFWFGAGISMWNSVKYIISPAIMIDHVGWEIWSVLGFSFLVDGYVLLQTIKKLRTTQPPNISFWKHITNIRDPTTAAVLMEDGAACVGVVIAVAGLGTSQLTGMAIYDGISGCAISALLAYMGLYLARLNQKYLIGQAVDPDIVHDIKKMLLSRAAIDEVHSVQTQWVGPYSFSYKAEVDFDGTYLAAKLLKRYQSEFMSGKNLKIDEVKLLLSWYAEDVMRTVEKEVREAESMIREKYPAAHYIELEPDSRKSSMYAIDDSEDNSLRQIEIDTINQYQAIFRKKKIQDSADPSKVVYDNDYDLISLPDSAYFVSPKANPLDDIIKPDEKS